MSSATLKNYEGQLLKILKDYAEDWGSTQINKLKSKLSGQTAAYESFQKRYKQLKAELERAKSMLSEDTRARELKKVTDDLDRANARVKELKKKAEDRDALARAVETQKKEIKALKGEE